MNFSWSCFKPFSGIFNSSSSAGPAVVHHQEILQGWNDPTGLSSFTRNWILTGIRNARLFSQGAAVIPSSQEGMGEAQWSKSRAGSGRTSWILLLWMIPQTHHELIMEFLSKMSWTYFIVFLKPWAPSFRNISKVQGTGHLKMLPSEVGKAK